MNIEHIRTFLEVATCGSFHEAADRLHVSQSTVSARMRNLETLLQCTLFERHQQGASLTDSGRNLLADAEIMIRSWQRARERVSLSETITSIFGIGISFPLYKRVTQSWISRMQHGAPDVALRVLVDFSEALNNALRDGQIEVAAMWYPRSMPGLVIVPLFEETLVLVSSKPCDCIADWMDQYILVHWGYEFLESHQQAFPGLRVPMLTVALEDLALERMLEHGGSCYLSQRTAAPYLEDGRLFRVEKAPAFSRPTYLATVANPSNRETLDTAIRHIRALLVQDEGSGAAA